MREKKNSPCILNIFCKNTWARFFFNPKRWYWSQMLRQYYKHKYKNHWVTLLVERFGNFFLIMTKFYNLSWKDERYFSPNARLYEATYDIGLIRLETPITDSKAVIPLCNRNPPNGRIYGMCGLGSTELYEWHPWAECSVTFGCQFKPKRDSILIWLEFQPVFARLQQRLCYL